MTGADPIKASAINRTRRPQRWWSSMGDRGLHYKAGVEYFRDNELEAVIHTTASNTTGERFHIIIPLLKPVSLAEHKAAVLAVCRFLDPDWVPDTTKLTCDSLFYVPGQYAGA